MNVATLKQQLEAQDLSWLPEPGRRSEGLEVLAFYRGKWTHVRWSIAYTSWSLGYGQPFIKDLDRAFAQLPEKPAEAEGFFEHKGPRY